VPTRANGQPAFATYVADPHTGAYRAYGLLVITIAGDRITAVTGFNASVLPRFGLPRTLPETGIASHRRSASPAMCTTSPPDASPPP
jgi:RNA polymerase sigma-70 factor (ECF subfamily)